MNLAAIDKPEEEMLRQARHFLYQAHLIRIARRSRITSYR